MKRMISLIVCFLILLGCVLPAYASGGVPQEVMEATKSVVRIQAEYYDGFATGSGFVIKNDGEEVLIATNDHVVEDDPQSIRIWVGEDRQVDAEIVFTTSAKDLCVLRITESVDMAPLTLSEEPAQHGSAIYAVGYPAASDILSDTEAHTSDTVTITDGIISSIRTFTIEENAEPVKLLLMNAAINHGNSGGPLFNTKGEVIGVNTYGVTGGDAQGVFGSVDISELWKLLDEYDIVLVEEVPETEPLPTEAPVPEKKSVPVAAIAIGAAFAVLALLLIVLSAKKRKKVTLRAYMARFSQGLGVSEAVSMLLPVAIALRNLHNDGKLHLQVSPDSILISAKGAILKEPGKKETDRHCSGFAAPEVYKGAGYGVASDIYSFAAVLLFAATGNAPVNSLQQEILTGEIAALEAAEPMFGSVIRSAMAFLPQDRTQSMQELIFGISAFHNQEFRITRPAKEKIPKEKQQEQPAKEEESQATIETDVLANQSPDRRDNLLKKRRNFLPAAAVLACGIIAVVLLWKPVIQPQIDAKKEAERLEAAYLSAVSLMEAGSYEDAMTVFAELTGYQDSDALHEECRIAMENAILEEKYQEAEALADDGKLGEAAIAFAKMDGYKDSRERIRELWSEITVWETVGVGFMHTVGLRTDGTVVTAGSNHDGQCDVDEWKDIVAISAGNYHTVGLRADGTVVATGLNDHGQCDVSQWENIVLIEAMGALTVGLCVDGTVVATGENDYGEWENIVAISLGWQTLGLCADGTVVSADDGAHNSTWNNITEISSGSTKRIGLCADGTVVSNEDTGSWKDIIAVSAGYFHVVGLRADGTVAAAGSGYYDYDGECNVGEWKDIIDIIAIHCRTIGLRADGTVVSVGNNFYNQCNVSTWRNIAAISAGVNHTVGIRADGTVVAAGWNAYGQCNVANWTDIKLPE